MKLDPGFPNHWKTERLIAQLGGDGVVALLRLLCDAQIRRQYAGLELTPKRLAMMTKWAGDAQKLFDVFTDPEAPWLDKEPDGTFTIHGFAEHQHQVVKLWTLNPAGRRGKVSPAPSSKEEDSSSCTYPIRETYGEPNGKHMVLASESPSKKSKAKGTLDEMKAFAVEIGMPADDGEDCFDRWQGNGWKNGGKPIADWQFTMRTWKRRGYLASQQGKVGIPSAPAGTHIVGGRAMRS